MREQLPIIELPLLPEDAEVELNLQVVFARAYEAAAHDRELDHTSEPVVPPFDAETTSWLRDRIASTTAVNR